MIAKTQEEIDALREGGKRLAAYVQELSRMVAPGVATKDLEERAVELISAGGDTPAFKGYKYASDKNPMPSALVVSINEVIVHNPAGESGEVIQNGDIVSLDMGLNHKGFYTDHAITLIVGDNRDPEDERMLASAREALAAGIAQARVGNTIGDIGHAVEKIARRDGFGYPRTLSGHGVGRTVHEEPHVPNFGAPGTGEKLAEGLVIAIEPMFTRGSGELKVDSGRNGHAYRTRDGSRTAHVEHTVLITKNGPEILTKAD